MITALTLLSMVVTTPILPVAIKCPHLVPDTLSPTMFILIGMLGGGGLVPVIYLSMLDPGRVGKQILHDKSTLSFQPP